MMGLYDEEVDCWIANHSALYLFIFGLVVMVGAFVLMPIELWYWLKSRLWDW